MNIAILTGRLGKDPVSKTLESGVTVASCTMATSSPYKNKAGEWVDNSQWHNLTCWKESATALMRFKKGDAIEFTGEIQYREYEKDGIKHRVTEIVGHPKKSVGTPAKDVQPTPESAPANEPESADLNPNGDDLPF